MTPIRTPPIVTTAWVGSSSPALRSWLPWTATTGAIARELVEDRRGRHVAGMQDQVDPCERWHEPGGQRRQRIADMRVGDHADPVGPAVGAASSAGDRPRR